MDLVKNPRDSLKNKASTKESKDSKEKSKNRPSRRNKHSHDAEGENKPEPCRAYKSAGGCNYKNCKFSPCCYSKAQKSKPSERVNMDKPSVNIVGYTDNPVPQSEGYVNALLHIINMKKAIPPVVKTPSVVNSAPEIINSKSKFSRYEYNSFMKQFNINCQNLDSLFYSIPEYTEYLISNYSKLDSYLNQFITATTSGNTNPHPEWINKLVRDELLDLSIIKSQGLSINKIIGAIHYGIYIVFKSVAMENYAKHEDLLIGFTLCLYACKTSIHNKITFELPSYEWMSNQCFVNI